MLLSILFLLPLPTIIFAKSLPRADDTKTNYQPTVCLSYRSFSSATVTFNDPRENSLFDYAVVTKYTTYYPDTLAHALVFNRFISPTLHNDRLCGWQKIKSVYGILGMDFHNHRGDIYWKYSHTPPITSGRPNEETINDISDILVENPPAGDAYMFCTIILAWTTSLLGYILFMLLLMACIKKTDRKMDESSNFEVDEGIELDSIKAPDTNSLAGTTETASSFGDVKYTHPSPQHDSTTSVDTMRFEPLPTYSRQG